MNKRKKIQNKLKKLGQPLGLNEVDVLKAKRTAKNIVTMAIVTGAIMLLGHTLMPGGSVGYYYGGGGARDFQLFFRGFF
jgi:hypothetical protein